MRTIVLVVLMCLYSGLVYPQDLLYRTDGSSQSVNIIEVAPASISYSLPAGNSIFVVSKDVVARIVFENGTEVAFNEFTSSQDLSNSPHLRILDHRNIISFNTIELIFGAVTLSYEGFVPSRIISGKFSFSIGLLDLPDYDQTSWELWAFNGVKLYSGTLAGNFFPFGHEKITWYMGMSFKTGKNRYYDYSYNPVYDPYTGNIISYHSKSDGTFYGFSVHNGFHFHVHDNWLITTQFGIGRMASDLQERIWFPLELGVGYKF